MLLDVAINYLYTALTCGNAAGARFTRRSSARWELSLHQLEERIVFSAELQSLMPIDSADFFGGSDLNDNSVAIEVPDSADQVDADFPPQAALAEATQTTLAFPEAAGFGAYAQGGRGGDVYHVTNLSDNGLGSLRHGIETMTGPRTIVFDVSGNIELASRLTVSQPYLTIAGQTAPGDGITIANHTLQIENTHDVIVRYIRMRAGDEDIANSEAATHDSFAIRWSENVIVDHVSVSWGIDETLATSWSENVTVQWSIVSESLSDSYHPKGEHGLASLSTGGSLSLYRNLYAHHDYRMPHLAKVTADVVNNVFYNWSSATPSSVGDFNETIDLSYVNFENNVYIAGPSLDPDRAAKFVFWAQNASEIWASGNVVDTTVNGILDVQTADFSLSPNSRAILIDSRFDYPVLPSDDPLVAYESILASTGSSFHRDAVDSRIVLEVTNQTGKVIDSQSEVGGFPNLASTSAPIDTDQDGMPDDWEEAFEFLDPRNPEDRNGDADGDGYTNLEEYLNQIAEPGRSLAAFAEANAVEGEVFELVVNRDGQDKTDLAPYRFNIDWNGDSRSDQTVNMPLGTVIEHIFVNAGDYPIQIEVTAPDGQTTILAHHLTVSSTEQEPTTDTEENEKDPVVEPTFSVSVSGPSTTQLNQSESFDINVSSSIHDLLTIEIDWNGNSRIDESVSVTPGAHIATRAFRNAGEQIISVFVSHDGKRVSTAEHHVFVVASPVKAVSFESDDLAAYDYHVMRRFFHASSHRHADDDDTASEG